MQSNPVLQLKNINVSQEAKLGSSWQASVALTAFPRLEEISLEKMGQLKYVAQWSLKANQYGRLQPWLTLTIDTELLLECQRCLNSMPIPIHVENTFRFAANEQEAEKEDEACEEDVLVNTPQFDLIALIEDEVLLIAPYSPRHEVCDVALKTEIKDVDFDQAEQEKKNPFEVLLGLKNK